MSNNLFEYYPEFAEYITLYRGIEKVWVADGTEQKPGTEGFLYTKLVNGTVQELGSLLSYDTAKQIYAAAGKTLTYETWLQLLLDSPINAVTAETAKDLAVSKADEASQSASDAAQSAESAEAERLQAERLKADTLVYASQAANAKDLAYASANATATSASNAAISETNAAASATSSATSATNSASSAAEAKSYADTIEEALQSTAVITYQNSEDGENVPETDDWTDHPTPEPGYFTWAKVVLNWAGLAGLTFYFVTGYKDGIATNEEIEEQFPGHTPYDEYASTEQINSLFNITV